MDAHRTDGRDEDSGVNLGFEVSDVPDRDPENAFEASGLGAAALVVRVQRVGSELVAHPDRLVRAGQHLADFGGPVHARNARRSRGCLSGRAPPAPSDSKAPGKPCPDDGTGLSDRYLAAPLAGAARQAGLTVLAPGE